jgi:hypothetical protein
MQTISVATKIAVAHALKTTVLVPHQMHTAAPAAALALLVALSAAVSPGLAIMVAPWAAVSIAAKDMPRVSGNATRAVTTIALQITALVLHGAHTVALTVPALANLVSLSAAVSNVVKDMQMRKANATKAAPALVLPTTALVHHEVLTAVHEKL